MKPLTSLLTLAVVTWFSVVQAGAEPILKPTVGFVARTGDSPLAGPVQFVTRVNEPFLVALAIDNLGGKVLGAFDLTLLYESSAFDLTGVAFGPHLGEPDLEAFTNFGTVENQLNLLELSLLDEPALDALQPNGAFNLVVLRLVAKVERQYGLFFVLPRTFSDAAGESIDVDVVGGSTIRVIPEPSVLWLIGAGIGVGMMRKSRTRLTSGA